MVTTPEVRITIDDSACVSLATDTAEGLALKAAITVQNRARGNAPVDTGLLRSSIQYERVESGPVTTYEVAPHTDYAVFQERGTGPIHASPGKVLRFKPKGSSAYIFRPRTRGVPASRYMERAANSINLSDFT